MFIQPFAPYNAIIVFVRRERLFFIHSENHCARLNEDNLLADVTFLKGDCLHAVRCTNFTNFKLSNIELLNFN